MQVMRVIFSRRLQGLQELQRLQGLLFSLIVVLGLAGCSTSTQLPNKLPSTAPTSVDSISQWQLEGKLGVRYQGKNDSVYMTWQRDKDAYAIELTGMLGMGATQIEGTRHYATLKRPGEAPVTEASVNQLVERYTGWAFPVTELNYWIKGQPAPDSSYADLNLSSEGQIQSFHQSGWLIRYLRYGETEGLTLPEKITATGPDTQVTLVIKSWHLSKDNTE